MKPSGTRLRIRALAAITMASAAISACGTSSSAGPGSTVGTTSTAGSGSNATSSSAGSTATGSPEGGIVEAGVAADAGPDATIAEAGTHADAAADASDGAGSGAAVAVTVAGNACALTAAGNIECFTPLTQVPTLTGDVAVVSAGGIGGDSAAFDCAVTTTGGAWCWGANEFGNLGNGTQTTSAVPVPVSGLGSGVAGISTGADGTACAVTTAGAVWCWGENDNGGLQGLLGNGSSAPFSTVPVRVTGFGGGVIAAVSVGATSSCALDGNGAVWCWGSNGGGELGNNSTLLSLNPVRVAGFDAGGIAAVSVGNAYACAVTMAGAVECWGNNGFGQSNVPAPITALGSGVTGVSAGYLSACAVVAGAVQCWGDNTYGELGNNSTTASAVPVPTAAIGDTVKAVSVGNTVACALTDGGAVWCWGGKTTGSVPARVVGFP